MTELAEDLEVPAECGGMQVRALGKGAPLVFLGTAAGNSDLFALTAWLLRDEFRCLLVDFPEIDRSLRPEHRLDTFSEILVRQLTHHQFDNVMVYGAGFGSLVALTFARRAPELVRKLLVQGVRPEVHWNRFERLLLWLGERSRRPLRRVPGWSRLLERQHREWFPPFDPTRWDYLQQTLGETSTEQYTIRVASRCPDLIEQASTIRCPVLMIQPEGEAMLVAESHSRLKQCLPDARIEDMHTSGQYPYVTHPHRVAKIIREFAGDDRSAGDTQASKTSTTPNDGSS